MINCQTVHWSTQIKMTSELSNVGVKSLIILDSRKNEKKSGACECIKV